MKTQCPQCKNQFSVKDDFAGRNAKCKTCGALFTIERAVPPEEGGGESVPPQSASPAVVEPVAAPRPSDAEPTGRFLLGLVGAAAGATVGALMWIAVALVTGYEHSALAMLCGVLGGVGALKCNGRENKVLGLVTGILVMIACPIASYTSYLIVAGQVTVSDYRRSHPRPSAISYFRWLEPEEQDRVIEAMIFDEFGIDRDRIVKRREDLLRQHKAAIEDMTKRAGVEYFTAKCESLCFLFDALDRAGGIRETLARVPSTGWESAIRGHNLLNTFNEICMNDPNLVEAISAPSTAERKEIIRHHQHRTQGQTLDFHVPGLAKKLCLAPPEARGEIITEAYPTWRDAMHGRIEAEREFRQKEIAALKIPELPTAQEMRKRIPAYLGSADISSVKVKRQSEYREYLFTEWRDNEVLTLDGYLAAAGGGGILFESLCILIAAAFGFGIAAKGRKRPD